MNALLWTLAIAGAINTLAVAYSLFFLDNLPPMTKGGRFMDAFYTAVIGIWAFAILMGQK